MIYVALMRSVPIWILGLFSLAAQAMEPAEMPRLPAPVHMNEAAGRGGLLIVHVKLGTSEEWPMAVDTGAPITLLDNSLASRLGKQLGEVPIFSFENHQTGRIYAAPALYLGDVRLAMGSNVFSADLARLARGMDPTCKGILGMDCLGHYCIQMDFDSREIRFLEAKRLDAQMLGKRFPLQGVMESSREGIPMIRHAGLLGGAVTNVVIDTGNTGDGMAAGRQIRRQAAGSYSGGLIKRTKHFLAVEGWVNRGVVLPGGVWDGDSYTSLGVARGPREQPDWIGLRFLARHLVTLDFPDDALYLKRVRSDPLPRYSAPPAKPANSPNTSN
jgi:hypothetical protein